MKTNILSPNLSRQTKTAHNYRTVPWGTEKGNGVSSLACRTVPETGLKTFNQV